MSEPSDREKPIARDHDTYKEDHWKVLDVEGVDKVFATTLSDASSPVRIDFDGEAAPSVMRDLGDEGDNVNVSAWLSLPDAIQLRDYLNNAIEEARDSR